MNRFVNYLLQKARDKTRRNAPDPKDKFDPRMSLSEQHEWLKRHGYKLQFRTTDNDGNPIPFIREGGDPR